VLNLHRYAAGNYQPLQERALWAGIADAYDEGIIKAVVGFYKLTNPF
jgi:hypothetical protein